MDSDEEEEVPAIATKKTTKNAKSKEWEWRKDLMEIIRLKSGLMKLNQERPSTAVIGNWGIIDGIEALAEQHQLGTSILTTQLFMGKKKTSKSKILHGVSKKDDNKQIQAQWDALRYPAYHSIHSIKCLFYMLFFFVFLFFPNHNIGVH